MRSREMIRAPLMRVLPAVVLAGLLACQSARAEEVDGVDCQLGFALANWLATKQSGTGVGTLRCDNNDLMVVRIKAKGRGITPGTDGIKSGRATFPPVRRIHDLLGTYVTGEARADDADVAHAQYLSKGEVGLTLSGREGWDRGITFDRIELLAMPMKAWRK